MSEKVISLIDMDCFYVQVEARENPAIQGVPAAVVQYKTWKGGGIIAVNYEARAQGVTRQMRGDEAKEKCPDIVLVRVPEVRDKADLTKYRKAGREVIEVLISFGAVVERASIDEAYLDLTGLVETRLKRGDTVKPEDLPNTHLGGHKDDREKGIAAWLDEFKSSSNESDLRLALGASIVEEMRAAVYSKTKFTCSAGIAHCKTLAKLCGGLNKPNKQTVLPLSSVPVLYATLPVTKVRGLGGKLGDTVTTALGVETMGQLAELSFRDLSQKFDEKTASWLHSLCKGFDNETVTERDLAKSIGCGKNFRGPDILDSKVKVELRLRNLVEELVERLEVDREDNTRIARGITVGTNLENVGYVSRAGPLYSYNLDNVYRTAYSLLSKLNTGDADTGLWEPRLLNISLSASKFEDLNTTIGNTQAITTFFKKKIDSSILSSLSGSRELTNSTPASPCSPRELTNSTPASNLPDSVNNSTCTMDTSLDMFAEANAATEPSTCVSKASESLQDRGEPCKPNSHTALPVDAALLSCGRSTLGESSGTAVKAETCVLNTPTKKQPGPQSFFRRKMLEMKEKEEREKREREEQEGREEEENESLDIEEDKDENRVNNMTQDCTDVPENVPEDVPEDGEIDVAELIPNLENFDPQILEFLPPKLRNKAKARVELLRREATVGKRDLPKGKGSKPGRLRRSKAPSHASSTRGRTSSSLTSSSSLQRFLVENSSNSNDTLTDLEKCEKCSKMISAFEMPEHLDFHFAKELLEETHQSAASSKNGKNVTKSSKPIREGGKSEKRKRSGEEKSLAKKQHQDISSFFKKS